MPIITRIYRTSSQRHYTIALDCGHKYVVENAMVKRDQLYVGKGIPCVECGPAGPGSAPKHTHNCGRTGRPSAAPNCRMDCPCWCHQPASYLDIQDLIAFTRDHINRLEAANDPHMTHERMIQADSAIQAALKRLNDIAEALRNRRPTT